MVNRFLCLAYISVAVLCSCSDYYDRNTYRPSISSVTVSGYKNTNEISLIAEGSNFDYCSEGGFVFGYDPALSDGQTIQVTDAEYRKMKTTVRLTRYGCPLYYCAFFRSAIGQEVKSDIGIYNIPPIEDFVNLSSPTVECITSSSITIKSLAKVIEGITIVESGFCYVSGRIPTVSDSHIKVVDLSDGGTISGLSPSQSLTIAAYTVDTDGNVAYSKSITVASDFIPEAVDLGLSVKWASVNVGATKCEDCGDYYAWGEVYPKSEYKCQWSYYLWCEGTSDALTKYNTSSSYGAVDGITVLESVDDVVHAKFGGSWRMPTEAEFNELKNPENCSWRWTSINGVSGYMVTSKIDGYTSNWIFLPAAGYQSKSSYDVGICGDYWSSSLSSGSPYNSYYLYFTSNNVNRSSGNRCCGRSVRPVSF